MLEDLKRKINFDQSNYKKWWKEINDWRSKRLFKIQKLQENN